METDSQQELKEAWIDFKSQLRNLLLLLLTSFVVSVPISFLSAYILKDIIHLFEIPGAMDLSMVQIYGTTAVLILILYPLRGGKKESRVELKETPFLDGLAKVVTYSIERTFMLLIGWGSSYIMYWLFDYFI